MPNIVYDELFTCEQQKMNYHQFIENKIAVSSLGGFDVPESELPTCLKPHQRDIVRWALRGRPAGDLRHVAWEKR